MKVVIPAAEAIKKEGVPNKVGAHYPPEFEPQIQHLIEKAQEKQKRETIQLHWEISLPKRPRSKGPRSQNNRIWGNCQDIADQISNEEEEYTAEEIKAAMQRMSVEEGYPTKLSLDGREVPKPTRYATVEEANTLLNVIQRYADQYELYLTEYDEQGPYRSVGGRTREEMRRYYE